MSDDLRAVLLGSGTPNAEPDRSGPAAAIVSGDTAYIVDCGPGVVRRAAAAFESGIRALEVPRLSRVFVTHLHSDHTAGLPDLILTPWVLGRQEPLEVAGPPGIRAMSEHLLAAYEQDIRLRRHGLEPTESDGWRVSAREIEPGMVHRDPQVTVEAFPVDHGPWAAFGYRFRSPDRTIVVSGDTAPTRSVVEMAQGCDLLVHEVYSATGLAGHDPEWRRYHSRMHTSSRELAEIASRTRPGLLVLYHQLFWGVSEEELLSEIRQGYDGAVVSGRDLAVY